MANSYIVVFIVDGDFEHLYFCTSDKYSEVLHYMGVKPERATFKTIPFETLAMVWDGKISYVMR